LKNRGAIDGQIPASLLSGSEGGVGEKGEGFKTHLLLVSIGVGMAAGGGTVEQRWEQELQRCGAWLRRCSSEGIEVAVGLGASEGRGESFSRARLGRRMAGGRPPRRAVVLGRDTAWGGANRDGLGMGVAVAGRPWRRGE